jgi:pyruvate ferredoxin oxidoreductase gamma subunit
VERPHLVAVFHDALLRTPGGLAGLRRNGTLIINTRKSLEELKAFGLPDDCHIYLTDALGIAIEEKSRVNTALMGTVTSVSGFLDPDAVLQSLSETFAKKHPSAVGPNERTFQRGLKELKLVAEPRPRTDGDNYEDEIPLRPGPKFGYLTAPIGGCITDAGNTFTKDLSASRSGFVPVLDTAECLHCGMCDIVCPDQCFVWRQEASDAEESLVTVRLEGIDYHYCKGCMRCIDSCPSGALTKQPEEEGFAEEHRVAMFPDSKS